jgi:hypothetical protein
MSCVCVLTPVVISSWPAIQAATMGALAAVGLSVRERVSEDTARRVSVEEKVENSQVLEEHMGVGETIVADREGLEVRVGRDERGSCTVCVSGEGLSEWQMRDIARDIAAKIVQQYTYNKVLSELKTRQFAVADEQVAADGTIKLHVRRQGS